MFNFSYKGIYKDEDQLEAREIQGSHPFDEAASFLMQLKDSVAYVAFMIVSSLIIMGYVIGRNCSLGFHVFCFSFALGLLMYIISIPLHEIIHGLFFSKKVEKGIWLDKAHSAFFIHCTGELKRNRFIMMSFAPTLILGIIPLIISVRMSATYAYPVLTTALAMNGAVSMFTGFADYTNIVNAYKQVPVNGYVYNSGLSSFWFVQNEEKWSKRIMPRVLSTVMLVVAIMLTINKSSWAVMFFYGITVISSFVKDSLCKIMAMASCIGIIIALLIVV